VNGGPLPHGGGPRAAGSPTENGEVATRKTIRSRADSTDKRPVVHKAASRTLPAQRIIAPKPRRRPSSGANKAPVNCSSQRGEKGMSAISASTSRSRLPRDYCRGLSRSSSVWGQAVTLGQLRGDRLIWPTFTVRPRGALVPIGNGSCSTRLRTSSAPIPSRILAVSRRCTLSPARRRSTEPGSPAR
jgi:hypothetical protein